MSTTAIVKIFRNARWLGVLIVGLSLWSLPLKAQPQGHPCPPGLVYIDGCDCVEPDDICCGNPNIELRWQEIPGAIVTNPIECLWIRYCDGHEAYSLGTNSSPSSYLNAEVARWSFAEYQLYFYSEREIYPDSECDPGPWSEKVIRQGEHPLRIFEAYREYSDCGNPNDIEDYSWEENNGFPVGSGTTGGFYSGSRPVENNVDLETEPSNGDPEGPLNGDPDIDDNYEDTEESSILGSFFVVDYGPDWVPKKVTDSGWILHHHRTDFYRSRRTSLVAGLDDLLILPGNDSDPVDSRYLDINDSGYVVGNLWLPINSSRSAIFVPPGASSYTLATYPESVDYAVFHAINDQGDIFGTYFESQVIGECKLHSGIYRPIEIYHTYNSYYSLENGWSDPLNEVGHRLYCTPEISTGWFVGTSFTVWSVNNSRDFVGLSRRWEWEYNPRPDGEFALNGTQVLGFSPGEINDSGVVVGTDENGAVLWEEGTRIPLPDPDFRWINGAGVRMGLSADGSLLVTAGDSFWKETEAGSREFVKGRTRSIKIGEEWTVLSLHDANQRGSIVATARNENTGSLHSILLFPVEIVPDFNRDGKIDSADRGQVSEDNPFRWWVNDDDDAGEAAGGKKAMGDIPNNGIEDHRNDVVDGMRDLVDFFPLHLAVKTLLEMLPAPEHTYRLKHSQGAFKFVEVPEIVPDGEPETEGAGSFIRSLDRAESLASAPLKEASPSGQNLTQKMLNALEKGNGIILLEATRETTAPIQLEILKGSESIAMIDFPVRISKVEDMYRHVDLRGVPTEYDGSSISAPASVNGTRTGDPGDPYPDELTNGKYFAFVHGYNVAQDKARGWHAETFKRLHQMGNRARYVGVVWQGDTGMDYHKAVFQAFQTGDQLTGAMHFVDGDLTIAAHSLGNVVVSHAVQNGGFAPDRYYLINAAVPREAYGGDIPAAERIMMIEDGRQIGNNGPHFRKWRNYDGAGQSRLLSAEWHTLFTTSDNRSKLKWNSAFGNATNLPLYNFYSPGDEVVRNPVDPTASALSLILDRGFDFSTYAWANQEYVKGGTSLAGALMERKQGGWVYNFDPPDPPQEGDPVPPETWDTGYFKYGRAGYRKYEEKEARDELTRTELRAKPFFKPFLELGLFDAANGSALAGQPNVKYDLMARGLPALSYAAAANPINRAQGNFDMEAEFQTDPQRWPLENHQSNDSGEDDLWEGRWLHSDFKNVALSHVYKMFDQMIETGGLDQ